MKARQIIEVESPKTFLRYLHGPTGTGRIKSICLEGRRWFQRLYGNTYYTANIFVNDRLVHTMPFAYGYGSQYEWDSWIWLIEKGWVKPMRYGDRPNNPEPAWQYCQRNGIEYHATVIDVRRKRDLHRL